MNPRHIQTLSTKPLLGPHAVAHARCAATVKPSLLLHGGGGGGGGCVGKGVIGGNGKVMGCTNRVIWKIYRMFW